MRCLLCMCAYRDSADGQAGMSVEAGCHAFHLLIEVAALVVSEGIERLNCDIKPAASAPLMPDTCDDSVYQKHRIVSGLTSWSQGASCGPPGKEPFAWVAANGDALPHDSAGNHLAL